MVQTTHFGGQTSLLVPKCFILIHSNSMQTMQLVSFDHRECTLPGLRCTSCGKACPTVQVCGAQIGTEEGTKRDIFAYFAGRRASDWNGSPGPIWVVPAGALCFNFASFYRMEILIFVAVGLVLAGPILAVVALVAVRRMEGDPLQLQIPQLTSRIYILEKRILALEQAIRTGVSAESEPEAIKPAT